MPENGLAKRSSPA